MINRKDLLLVSASMTGNEEKCIAIKLLETQQVLTTDYQIETLKRREVSPLIKNRNRIFKNKPQILKPILEQLQESLKTNEGSNLSSTFDL
jgi:hypothetical protein